MCSGSLGVSLFKKVKILKTNVVMIRKMGTFEVTQRTKDGMFNANNILKQWNFSNNSKKKLKDYFKNKSTKDFIKTMQSDDEFMIGGIVPMIKSKANKGDNAGTWMHPYLFIDYCMWLNPKFKLSVIKFVYDELIKNRHSAGDNYKMLSSAGVKLKGYNFKEVATALNWIVFNKNAKDLRQSATQEELQEISEIESKLAYSIDMGYIKDYEHLLKEMSKLWNKKYAKF